MVVTAHDETAGALQVPQAQDPGAAAPRSDDPGRGGGPGRCPPPTRRGSRPAGADAGRDGADRQGGCPGARSGGIRCGSRRGLSGARAVRSHHRMVSQGDAAVARRPRSQDRPRPGPAGPRPGWRPSSRITSPSRRDRTRRGLRPCRSTRGITHRRNRLQPKSEVCILTPYVSKICVLILSGVLTSLSLGAVRNYALCLVATRPKPKHCRRLHSEWALAVNLVWQAVPGVTRYMGQQTAERRGGSQSHGPTII